MLTYPNELPSIETLNKPRVKLAGIVETYKTYLDNI